MLKNRPEGPSSEVVAAVESDCETVRFHTPSLLIGAFRCGVESPRFRDAGKIRNCVVAFPRRAVWIHRDDSPAFVADPTLATIYSPGVNYERRPLAREGDQSDWFAVSEPLARELVRAHDPAAADGALPLPMSRAAVSPTLFWEQRALVEALEAPVVDRAEIEERALMIVSEAIREATAPKPRAGRTPTVAGRALVEEAKEVILERLFENTSVTEIATALGSSPFHLCRVFRAVTGSTLHGYRRELRLRVAVELAAGHRGRLSSLAIELGFHSHAHFTASYREAFGVPPSATLTQERKQNSSPTRATA